jgi:hypothetical protein
MSRKLLLRIAAFLTLFTFLGHTFGALSGPPKDQPEMANVLGLMDQTMVSLPMATKSISTLMLGANLCLSVLLMLSGLLFVNSSTRTAWTKEDGRILLLNSLAMVATGAISAVCFFPMPAVCTGLAGILGLISLRSRS